MLVAGVGLIVLVAAHPSVLSDSRRGGGALIFVPAGLIIAAVPLFAVGLLDWLRHRDDAAEE